LTAARGWLRALLVDLTSPSEEPGLRAARRHCLPPKIQIDRRSLRGIVRAIRSARRLRCGQRRQPNRVQSGGAGRWWRDSFLLRELHPLVSRAGCDGHSGADRHPVTLRAHQAQRDPVVVIFGFVEKKRRRCAALKTRMSSLPSLFTSPTAVPAGIAAACIQAGSGGNFAEFAVRLIEKSSIGSAKGGSPGAPLSKVEKLPRP